jgi:peroxiredoxin Q/BCP
MTVKEGQKAPAIQLEDQDGVTRKLSDYKGKWVVVYFYPKDDTPGCTKEACAFRDEYKAFGKLNAEVIGISPDPVDKHGKFVTKFDLPFTLLADEEKKVMNAYGVWGKKKFMGREYEGVYRQSLLVDPKGKVAKVYEKVKPDAHAADVLADIEEMSDR